MSDEHNHDQADSRRGPEVDGPLGVGSVLVDRYELGEVLGHGGMADVYRGVDRLLGRAVAIKILRNSANDETALERFTSEARTLARLSHSRLVVVLDAGFASHRPFIVMELVDGPTLAQVIAGGPLPFPQLLSVGVQVAQALAHAHEAGVVHRDVKPGNVLVGSDGHVKLADFGIARLVDDAVRHTQTGMSIGTAAYLAPEQVRGEPVTVAADVYSLALVLIEAATGERVFPGTLTESALARLHRGPVIPKDLPTQWQSTLARMSALDPSARPTAAEVASTLRLSNVPISAGLEGPIGAETGPAGLDDADGTILLTQATPAPGATGRLKALPTPFRAAAAVVFALMALILIVGIAASNDRQNSADDLPDQVPGRFEGPLRDLHDAVNSPAESAPELASALDRVDSAIVGGRSAEIEDAVDTLILATRQAQEEGRIDLAEADRIIGAAENVLAQLPDDAAKLPESEPPGSAESPTADPTHGGESPGKGKGKKKQGRGKP